MVVGNKSIFPVTNNIFSRLEKVYHNRVKPQTHSDILVQKY